MSYNKENFLKRVIEVQEITWHYRQRGLFYKEIYHNYIEKQFKISKRTFSKYLGISAKRDLKSLKQKSPLKKYKQQ